MKHFAIIFYRKNFGETRLVLECPGYSTKSYKFDSALLSIIHSDEFDMERHIYIKEGELAAVLDGYILENEIKQCGVNALVALYQKNGIAETYPGLYNFIVYDEKKRRLIISNDDFGCMPLYHHVFAEGVVVFNSMHLFKQLFKPNLNSQGFSENFNLGWTIGEKTVFDNVFRTLPGSRIEIDIPEGTLREKRRLSKTWSSCRVGNGMDFIRKVEIALDRSVERYKDRFGKSMGLMLSGGLDSRLILGALSKKDISILNCFHGNESSVEADCAVKSAELKNYRLLLNPMNARMDFAELEIEEQHRHTDLIFNPIWMKSVRMLFREGVTNIATGCLGDGLLAGSYSVDMNLRKRFLKNIALSCGWPIRTSAASEADLIAISSQIYGQASKRSKNYARLLNKPYQELVIEGLKNTKNEIQKILGTYLQGEALKGDQIQERFFCEHRVRKYVFGQELVIHHLGGNLVTPILDKDLCEILTNIDPDVKYDHHFYYKFFRHYSSDLAKIEVPNLYGSIYKPQILIELSRIVGKKFDAYRVPEKKRTWTHFNEWIKINGKFEKMQKYFLDMESFFEPDAIRSFFQQVKQGERSIYDGNEILNFLSLGWLIKK